MFNMNPLSFTSLTLVLLSLILRLWLTKSEKPESSGPVRRPFRSVLRRGSWSETHGRGDYLDSSRAAEQRGTRDQFNFYNLRPQNGPQRPSQLGYPHDDAEDLPPASDQQSRPYQPDPYSQPSTYQPYNNPPPYTYPSYIPPQPYTYPPYNYPYNPPPSSNSLTPTQGPPDSSTTASTSIAPIGYMLIDTYTSRGNSYSQPVAFFMNA